MCKMIAFSRLPSGSKESKLNALLVKAAKLLGESQRDGFGVAISHGKQLIYRERHLSSATFNGLGSMHWSVSVLPKGMRTKLKDGVDFDHLGKIPNLASGTGPVVLHGRTATCAKQINNTHPFVKYDDRLGNVWTLAHNGVVEWEGTENLPLETTCDSEHLLNCYAFLQGEESFKGRISGYAATLGITPHGELFCFRDNRAPLYICYSQELDVSILASDETHAWELMAELCKITKTKIAKVGEPMMLEDWTSHTWTMNDGVVSIAIQPFDAGYGKISSTYVGKAFGTASSAYDDSYYGRSSYGGYGTYSSTASDSKPTTPGFKQLDEEAAKITKSLREKNEMVAEHEIETLDRMIAKVEASPTDYTQEMKEEIRRIKNRKRLSEKRRAKLLLDSKSISRKGMTVEEYNYILYGETGLHNLPASSTRVDLDVLSEADWQRLADEGKTDAQADQNGIA